MPSEEIIRKALAAIQQDEADRIYFFETLTSPDWIKPLWDAGVFQSPPQLIKDAGYVNFPLWAESRYVARMAPIAPETVLEVVLAIPETENVRVHEDFLDAALSMPAQLASKLVPKIRDWIRLPYHLLLTEKLSDLVLYLVLNRQVDPALDLARSLFMGLTKSLLGPGGSHYSDIWQYQEILKKHIPHLVAVAMWPTLNLLCDLLVVAIKYSRDSDKKGLGSIDQSYFWRPAIEAQELSQLPGFFELRGLLTSTLRDAAIEAVRSRQVSLGEMVKHLESFRGIDL